MSISVGNAGYTTFRGNVRVLAIHSIRQFPLHFPSRASLCAIRFQTHSTDHYTTPFGYSYGQLYTFKPLSSTTLFTNLQVTSFDFPIKPSPDLLIIESHTKNLYLHVVLRSHSLTTYVIKTYVKIQTSCVKL